MRETVNAGARLQDIIIWKLYWAAGCLTEILGVLGKGKMPIQAAKAEFLSLTAA